MKTNLSSQVTLDVYVSAHCWQCPEARQLARETQNEFAALVVRVINLDQPGALKPAFVFAVPTFVLDGQVISLGTPARETLNRRIRRALTTNQIANEH
jgi:hypothetical protein